MTHEMTNMAHRYGITSSDEILILEEPGRYGNSRNHSNLPQGKKWRLVGPLTEERMEQFFDDYGKGRLPRYYKTVPAMPGQDPPPAYDSLAPVEELTGLTFEDTVND